MEQTLALHFQTALTSLWWKHETNSLVGRCSSVQKRPFSQYEVGGGIHWDKFRLIKLFLFSLRRQGLKTKTSGRDITKTRKLNCLRKHEKGECWPLKPLSSGELWSQPVPPLWIASLKVPCLTSSRQTVWCGESMVWSGEQLFPTHAGFTGSLDSVLVGTSPHSCPAPLGNDLLFLIICWN